MASPTYYAAGTVSVANGATAVTGVGTAWMGKVYPGDLLANPAQPMVPPQRIAIVTDDTHLVLAVGWPGTTMAAAGYEVRITPDATRVQERTRELLEALTDAANLGFDPPSGMTADDVQAAIEELNADIDGFAALPVGGAVGQVLKKQSSTDGDADWEDDAGPLGAFLSSYADLPAAITALGSTETLLTIDRDETVSTNITVPKTITLAFTAGSVLTVATGVVLTINASINAAGQQLFSIAGTGVVLLSGSMSGLADVAWFGAMPDFSGTDDAPAINAAIRSLAARVRAHGRFKLATNIDFTPWGTTIDPGQTRKFFDAGAGHFFQAANLATAVDLCPSDTSVLVKKTIDIGSLYGRKDVPYTNTRAVYLRHVANCSIRIGLIENWAGKGFEVDQTGTPAWGGFANDIGIDKISNNAGDGFYAAAATSGSVGFEGNTVRITHSIGNGGRAYVIGAAADQRVEGNNFRIGAADGNTGSAIYFGGKGNFISFGALYGNGSPDIDCATGISERNRLVGWLPASLVVSNTVKREHGINGYPEYLNSGSAATTAVMTEETLMSYSIPANTLKPGMKVKLRAWGTTAANANNKIVRLKFGGAGGFIAAVNAGLNAVPWEVEGEVLILASNSQEYHSIFHLNALGPLIRQGTSTETDTGAIVCSLTGQNGTASAGDITVQGFRVEIVG